jgi:subtilase family serine protease
VIARVYGDDTTAENLCDILADVRNAGSAEAPATTTRFLSSQPGQFDQLIATPALAAGQTTTVRVAREYGDYNRATVTADAGNLIAETDETNNTGSGSGSPSTSAIGEENSARCRYP